MRPTNILTNFCQIGGLLLLLCTCGSPLIVPTGLVSLLHYIYSRIPIINKGTDSRLGIGFRLGPHADLQFLVELGPQQHTQSLGDPQNPPPCCGDEELPGVQDISNKLTIRSPGITSPEIRSSETRNSVYGNLDGRKARDGVLQADWLTRWQAGVKERAPRSHEKKTEIGGPMPTKATPTKKVNSPLLTVLHKFRDLWVAGRNGATDAPLRYPQKNTY